MKTILLILLIILLHLFTSLHCLSAKTATLSGEWTDYGNYKENSVRVGEFTILKYSTDGKYIYTFSNDSMLRKWDNITGEILFETNFDYFGNKPNGIEFYGLADISPDGKYILICHWKQNIYDITAEVFMYNISTKEVKFIVNPPFRTAMTPYGGPPVYVFGASVGAMFSFDGSVFVTNVNLSLEYSIYTANGVQSLWNSSDGSNFGKNHGGVSCLLSISKDSKYFAYSYWVSYDMNLKLPDVYGLRLNDTAVYMNNSTNNLAFTNDSKNLAWIANENNIRTLFQWDISNNELLKTSIFEKNDKNSINMMFTNDDRFFLYEKDSGLIFYQYPTAVKALEMNFDFIEENILMRMNPETNELAVACKDGILRKIKLDKVAQELVSIFRADTTIVLKGNALVFTDYSYGEPGSWNWNFGDGTYSTEKNPAHSYNQKGNYTVSLIVSNGTRSDTSIKENYISVVEPSAVNDNTSNEKSLSITPHPANNFIELPDDLLNENQQLFIYSTIGVCVYKGIAKKGIDISNLSPGIYFLKVNDKVYKFVKM